MLKKEISKTKKKLVDSIKFLFFYFLKFIFLPFIKIDNRILIFGMHLDKFSDNPKYLYLYVIKNCPHLYPVWFTNNESVLKMMKAKGYRVVKKDSIKAFLLMMKAKYIFFSHGVDDVFYVKRKETVAVNLWHGSPLKKMGFQSRVDLKGIRRKQISFRKLPYETWDYIIASSGLWIDIFYKSMKLEKNKILATGLPRNDILWEVKSNKKLRNTLKEKILNLYGIKDYRDCKIILYAPTFRTGRNNRTIFEKEFRELISLLKKKNFSEKTIFLIRLHPSDYLRFILKVKGRKNIIDVTDYDDMQELLAITDLLITDYSSSIFDFIILEKPIILYTFDWKVYLEERGGLYDILDEHCFKKAFERKELLKILDNFIKNEKFFLPSSDCALKYNKEGKSSEKIIIELEKRENEK